MPARWSATTGACVKHIDLFLRQQIIEHIFGTIKRQWGFDHIRMKRPAEK